MTRHRPSGVWLPSSLAWKTATAVPIYTDPTRYGPPPCLSEKINEQSSWQPNESNQSKLTRNINKRYRVRNDAKPRAAIAAGKYGNSSGHGRTSGKWIYGKESILKHSIAGKAKDRQGVNTRGTRVCVCFHVSAYQLTSYPEHAQA